MFVLLCLRANSSFCSSVYMCSVLLCSRVLICAKALYVQCPYVYKGPYVCKGLVCSVSLYVQCPYMGKVLIWMVGECGGARPSVVLSFCGNSLFVHEVSFCYTS